MTARGVEASVDGTRLAVGRPKLVTERDAEMPTELRDEIETWKSRGAAVLYLPGPRRDVGIAIGAGADVAIESAGVILASHDPRSVVGIFKLSKASYRKMVQNLVWATGYNALAIPLTAGVLAWAGVTVSPAVGAILMSVSTIVVAINAQFLRRIDLRSYERVGS